MTLDDILASLFPERSRRDQRGRRASSGSAMLRAGDRALVIGVAGRTPLGVDEAIRLSGYVLDDRRAGRAARSSCWSTATASA